MMASNLTIVVNNAEIEKQIAISINSREYYYYKWKPLIEKNFQPVRTILNIRIALILVYFCSKTAIQCTVIYCKVW